MRAHVLVWGEVQGVFFRGSARDLAISRGVAGWIRNRPDGSVEAMFEGQRADVEALVQWCRQGPPGARVEWVDEQWEPFRGEFAGFTVS